MKKKAILSLLFCGFLAVSLNADIITGFDTSEGFTVGSVIGGQNGWTQFNVAHTQPTVSSANPFSGDAHLRIGDDATVATGTLTGGFSPIDTVDGLTASTFSIQVAINDDEADYDIVGQTPIEGFLTYRMKFNFEGNIFVLDDVGAGLAFQDTGVAFDNVGNYTEVIIEFDPVAGIIEYFYGGSLVYTGGLVAGTRVEQIILLSDNFQRDSVIQPAFGDFDDFSLVQNTQAVPEPTTVSFLGMVAIGMMVRRRR